MAASFAICTLLTNDAYLPGAIALAAALRDLHPKPAQAPEVDFQSVCIVTPETVDVSSIKLLRRTFDLVVGVELIEQDDDKNLQLLGRPDLSQVLTKLHVFRLIQFSKILFLDADVLPLRPLSHLLTLPHDFAAVPDVGWPDIFNSGVMVLTPSESSFEDIRGVLKSRGSWDGGDQGLLNEWRGDDWHRLSFTYNTTPTAAYTYAPAYERFGSKISAIHFIGPNKPWTSIPYRAPGSTAFRQQVEQRSSVYDYGSLVDRWFAVYDKHYRSNEVTPGPLDFEVQKYDAVWDDSLNLGAEVVPSAAQPASLGSGWAASHGSARLQAPQGVQGFPSQVQTSGPMGLDELRRLAVEGIDGMILSGGYLKPEGEYRRLPLDGRIDLMRQKREVSVLLNEDEEDGQRTPQQQIFDVPNPDEAHHHHHHHHHGAQPGHQRRRSYRTREQILHEHNNDSSDSGMDGNWLDQPPFPGHRRHRASPPRSLSPPVISWNPATDPPPNDPPPPSNFPAETYFTNVWDQPHSRTHDGTQLSSQVDVQMTDSDPFFRAPPPSAIPESLLRQGHYDNVVHGQPDPEKVKPIFPWESQQRPSASRAFPKTDSPPLYVTENPLDSTSTPIRPGMRHSSSSLTHPHKLGFTNAWDAIPSIAKYAKKLAKTDKTATPPRVPSFDDSDYLRERDRLERQEATNRDADDEDDGDDDDSDDDHSSRAYSRSRSRSQLESEGDQSSRSHKTKRQGSNSRPSSHARIRSGANSPTTAPFIVKKEYRSAAVQTFSHDSRSTDVQVPGLQVAIPSTAPTPVQAASSLGGHRHSSSASRPLGLGEVRRTSFSNRLPRSRQNSSEDVRGRTESLPTRRDRTPLSLSRMGGNATALGPAAQIRSAIDRKSSDSYGSPSEAQAYSTPSPIDDPALMLRRQKLGHVSNESHNSSPTASGVGLGFGRPTLLSNPQRIEREVSGESFDTTTTSPPESIATPVTPYGDFGAPLVFPAGRKSGRSWNPNTGIDVFKKSSKEVLARFLRHDSSSSGTQSPTAPGPVGPR